MSSSSLTFNLHGLVRGRVQGPNWFMGPVRHELSAHEDKEQPIDNNNLDLDIELAHWGRGKGQARSDSTTKYSWQGKHLIANWQVSMSGPETSPRKLLFQGNLPSRNIVSKWIVEPAIRLVAEKKGAAMVHAAALSDGENAILVAGPATAGKTTWVLNWLQAGHPYMSDDFTLMLDQNLMPYITPLRLGAKNLLVNKALSRMAALDKARIVIRTMLRRALFGYAKFYFKAPIQRAIPGVKIGEPAKLAGAVWLGKEYETRSPEDLAELMTEVDLAEMHGFGADFLDGLNSTDHTGSTGFRGFENIHRRRLAGLLANKPCLCVPAHNLPPKDALSSIPELLLWLQQNS